MRVSVLFNSHRKRKNKIMHCVFVYPVFKQLEHSLDGGYMDRQIHGKETASLLPSRLPNESLCQAHLTRIVLRSRGGRECRWSVYIMIWQLSVLIEKYICWNSLYIPTAINKSNALTKKENKSSFCGCHRPIISPVCLPTHLPTCMHSEPTLTARDQSLPQG